MLPEPDAELALEHGLFSTAQARRSGLTHAEVMQRLRRGRWVRVSRGVLRDVNHELTSDDNLLLAFLRAGPQAVVGLRSAATVLGLDVLVKPPHPELLLPRSSDRAPTGARRAELKHSDVMVVGLLRVTTAERTVIDCAARVSRREAVVLVDSAYRSRLVTPADLERAWRGRPRLRGHVRAGEALVLADPLSGSTPETEFRLLLLDAGVLAPVSQYEVIVDGRLLGRADFAWPEFRLIVEIDGYEFHSGPSVFQRDRTRGNDLLEAGWDVLHFTVEDLRLRPADVVARVRRRLAAAVAAAA